MQGPPPWHQGAPGPGGRQPPPPPPLPDASPNAVAVGSAVGANGAVTTQLASYAAGETVYASVPTAGHSPGDSVRIYWTNAKGLTDKEEEKEVAQGQAYVTFEFSQADGMQPGPYNAQVDINDTPVGIVDFTVQ